MSDITFNTIEEMIANILNLPVGTIRAIANFDLSSIINAKVNISKKDWARIVGFIPAVLQKAADIGVSVGFEIGLQQALDGAIDANSVTITKSVEFDALVKEACAVATAFLEQSRHPLDNVDPFKEEREVARVFAKKFNLDANYQKLLGVSEGTKDTYENWFVKKYL